MEYTVLMVASRFWVGWGGSAQRPRVSPHETTSASVDQSEMSIVYGRPSMRGRTIFGRLVPYGDVWCPGADEATMLSTTRPLRMGPLALAAGEYRCGSFRRRPSGRSS